MERSGSSSYSFPQTLLHPSFFSDALSSVWGHMKDVKKHQEMEEKGATEHEIVGWHHQLNAHEFEQTPGHNERHGSVVCCGPWGCRVRPDLVTDQQQRHCINDIQGFPGGAGDKELVCQCRKCKSHRFSPSIRKIWRRAQQPTSVFLPEESHGQRSLRAYSPQGLKEWDTTYVTAHANNGILLHVSQVYFPHRIPHLVYRLQFIVHSNSLESILLARSCVIQLEFKLVRAGTVSRAQHSAL